MKATIGAAALAVALAFPGAASAVQRKVTVETTTVVTTTVATTTTTGPAGMGGTTGATGSGTTPETTIVQTTTVPAPFKPGSPKQKSTKCAPGTTDPNMCEQLPPHPRAKPQKAKPQPSPPQRSAPAPTEATALPAGPSLPRPSPTLSGLAAKAVNTLIDLFPIPPFLLPIYQAAGDAYDVPWPVLAAINEIETDYGRNLSVSSAGAIGWMQFMPSTWMKYGLDADGGGTANPYDPIDAIFAAARYLHDAGAERNLRGAIFAYNHAGWYVNSVVLRARLLQYLPQSLIDALAGLMQASFPVAGHLGRYAGRAPRSVRIGGQRAAILSAPAGAPVIAVADGRVVAVGHDARRGRYVTIQDSYGNQFTYLDLGTIREIYPVLKARPESVAQVTGEAVLRLAEARGGAAPAAADVVASGLALGSATGAGRNGRHDPDAKSRDRRGAVAAQIVTPEPPAMVKERLFADPLRPASYAAGGRIQLQTSVSSYALATWLQVAGRGAADYFSQPLHLHPDQFTLAALRRGAIIAAGTILGRVPRARHGSSGIVFQIRPAGATAPVDPTSIIAGWELLGRLTAGRSALVGAGESGAYGSRNVSVGQLLLGSKSALGRAVLADRRVSISRCGRRDIEARLVDRRVLAVIEYLSYSGLAPDVSGFVCGQPSGAGDQLGTDLQITKLDGIPVAGHQRNGGVVDLAIRALLRLQGSLRPERIISLRSYPWQSATIALPDHAARLEVDFSPAPGGTSSAAEPLNGGEWKRLMGRLAQLDGQPGEPTPFVTAPASAQ